MKAVVAAFNQEKALVGAFSVITNLRMEFFQALLTKVQLLAASDHLVPAAYVVCDNKYAICETWDSPGRGKQDI